MPIEENKKEYKSHKHTYNVYVDLNTRTKLGENLLNQYHEQQKNHCMDVGRIGYHDKYGRYIIDEYTRKELIVVPKLIIRVTECAVDRAGKDVYQLRTYMSKFGQLNFLLTIDRDKAELFLVENIYIENINHREDYETLLFKLTYFNQKPVPIKEIFYKFGIKANPDDYGKSWKEEDVKINNILVSKAKAEMTKQLANKLASSINQKALVTSLNYLNKENTFGQKVTEAYSKKVATEKQLTKMATEPKLENTLNNVLLKTLEEQTTKKDVQNKTNFMVYKRVLDVQMTTAQQLSKEIEKANTKENFKNFLVNVYQKTAGQTKPIVDEGMLGDQRLAEFENILDFKYDRRTNKENYLTAEEVFEPDSLRLLNEEKEYRDFNGKKVDVNLDADRFENPENKAKKKIREKQEKENKKKEKALEKVKNKQKRRLKRLNAECDLDVEFERSKSALGIAAEDKKKKKKKSLEQFFQSKKDKKLAKDAEQAAKNEDIIKKIEKRVKAQSAKKQERNDKKTKQKQLKELKKEKKLLFKEYGIKEDKKKEKNKKKEEEKRQKIDTILMSKQAEAGKAKESANVLKATQEKPSPVNSLRMQATKKEEVKPVAKPVIEKKKEEKQNVFATPKPTQEPPKNKTVYISAFEEDAQKKPKGHFDYVTGRRVSQTVKERTQDM